MQSQKWQNDLCLLPRQTIQYHSIQVYAPTSNVKEAEVQWFYKDLQDLLEWTPNKNILLIIGDWNAKVGSQEIPGVSIKFGLGVQNEAGQRLTEFAKITHWSQQTPSSNNTRDDSIHGHHQMVNTEIRLITFYAAEYAETLYSQQKKKKIRSWLWLGSWTPYCQIQT